MINKYMFFHLTFVGRGGNAWLSPQGALGFSLLVRLEVRTELGQRLSFLQHIASQAVVQAVCTLPGYEVSRTVWELAEYLSGMK